MAAVYTCHVGSTQTAYEDPHQFAKFACATVLTSPRELCGCQGGLNLCALQLQVVQPGESCLIVPLRREVASDSVVTCKVAAASQTSNRERHSQADCAASRTPTLRCATR